MSNSITHTEKKTSAEAARSKTLVPKLRFKGFSGEWKTKKYSELTTLVTNGFVGKAKDFYVEANGITYIQGYNVMEGGFNLRGIKQVSVDFHKKNKKSDLVEGDLLTIQTGDIGTTTIVTKELAGSNCHALIISRFKSELAFPYFYMLLFNSQRGRNQLKTIETGSTMKHLNVGDIIDLIVQYPTLPEQQKIASFLSAVDEKIQQLSRKKELLEQYKKGAMQQLFSGKLRFKIKNKAGELVEPPKWEEKRLGNLENLVQGDGDWILSENITKGEKYSIIQLGNIGLGEFIDKEMKTLSEEDFKKIKGTKIKSGDLLINRMVDDDKLNVCLFKYEGNYVTSVDVCWIRLAEGINNYFFMYLLTTRENQKKLLSLSSGSGRVRISKKNFFDKFSFQLPSTNEQKKIAAYLSNIDNKIESVTKQITQTQTFKKGLLQQMFV